MSTKFLLSLRSLTGRISHHGIRRYLQTNAVLVRDMLQKAPCESTEMTVKGWVRGLRKHGDVAFVNLFDGSCGSHLQVVIPSHKLPIDVCFGCCLEANGFLMSSQGSAQNTELAANSIHIIGSCDSQGYPFKARTRHTQEYVRQFPHLRSRTNTFGALLRLRSAATHAIHQFFQDEGYCNIHTPIITANDCEGAGEVFTVQPRTDVELTHSEPSGEEGVEDQFFGVPAYLTVSGQLHLEAAIGGFDKVYTFNPTFRAENARGTHHLNEFYMIEAELAFTHSLEDLMQVIERLTVSMTQYLLSRHKDDVSLFTKHIAPKDHLCSLDKIASGGYIRLSYTEAMDILLKKANLFKFKPMWGCDLQKEHERYLVEFCDNVPVFVTDFPASIKAFYARQNTDGETVACMDLLAPIVGELCGGSLREERYDVLKDKLDASGIADKLDWYLDLRRFGSVPHGGFGIGFERYLQAVLGIANIKDTIPFPRSRNNCRT